MFRLIDAIRFREKLLEFRSKAVDKWGEDGTVQIIGMIDSIVKKIDDAPTIDPESLRPTAHWVKDGDVENPYRGSGTRYHCSACGRRAGYKQRRRYKYCPSCGAKIEDCT